LCTNVLGEIIQKYTNHLHLKEQSLALILSQNFCFWYWN